MGFFKKKNKQTEVYDYSSMDMDERIKLLENTVRYNKSDINKIYGKLGSLLDTKKTLKYVNKSPNKDPFYAKSDDSGFDICAWISNDNPTLPPLPIMFDEEEQKDYIILKPHTPTLIHTGLYFELPKNTELQVRSRSGCSLKQGLIVLNSPGTVDCGYRNEVCVIAYNATPQSLIVHNGDRIAQAVLCPVYNESLVRLLKINKISTNTNRGEGGFGHTGIK